MKTKYILLIVALFAACSSIKKPKTPQPVDVTWANWNDAYPQAKKDKKLVLVDVYTNWCGWCKKMDRDVFTDPQVENMLASNFVTVKLNPERTDMTYAIDTMHLNGTQMYNLLTNGQRTGFPTIVVLDPSNNQIIHAEAGYLDAAEFTKTMQQVLGSYAKK
jgi:uncharacterized protein YyaL (SSP411 family)